MYSWRCTIDAVSLPWGCCSKVRIKGKVALLKSQSWELTYKLKNATVESAGAPGPTCILIEVVSVFCSSIYPGHSSEVALQFWGRMWETGLDWWFGVMVEGERAPGSWAWRFQRLTCFYRGFPWAVELCINSMHNSRHNQRNTFLLFFLCVKIVNAC